jgi:hypothetical protein
MVTLPLFIPRRHKGSVFKEDASDLKPANAAIMPFRYDISPGYFEAAGTSLLAGRSLSWQDDKNAPAVAVINRDFAEKIFGSVTNAVGRNLQAAGWDARPGGGSCRERKIPGSHGRSAAGDVSSISAIAMSSAYLWCARNAIRSRLAAAMRSKIRELDAGLPADTQTWTACWRPFCFLRAWPPWRWECWADGRDAFDYRHISDGCVLGEQAAAGVGNSHCSRRKAKEVLQAALGRPLKLLVIGSAAGPDWDWLATKGAGLHCVSGDAARSAGAGRRGFGHVAARPAGYVDSGAARAVGESIDSASRGLSYSSKL